ncbi:DUF5320 domain-containing protein [Patescibacteria group bacterium]
MPNFDKTGPQGMGPATGRGFGPCGFGMGGRGFGRGRGLGRYFGWGQPQTKEEKLKALSDYKKALKEELEDVEKEEKEAKGE